MTALAVLTAALSAAAPEPVHFTGRFQLSYTPLYCTRAPCPASARPAHS